MALTATEFARQLQPLLGDDAGEVQRGAWRLRWRGQVVEIACRPLAALQLGALSLPQVEVSLTFTSDETAQQDAFMTEFMNCFRRGGG